MRRFVFSKLSHRIIRTAGRRGLKGLGRLSPYPVYSTLQNGGPSTALLIAPYTPLTKDVVSVIVKAGFALAMRLIP